MKFELNKQFARKMAIMLEANLIWYKHYFLFCDEIIEEMDRPPYWIIDLASIKYIRDAENVVNNFAFSEPFVAFPDSLNDLYVSCLFLRYERRELSWASFLKHAGDYADSTQAVKCYCQYFYYMLNDYKDSEYSTDLENKQMEIIKEEFNNELHEARIFYAPFADYFRKYVASQPES